MTHADDDGMVIPPRLAPKHVVILPIYRSDDERKAVLEFCNSLQKDLTAQRYDDAPVRVQIDDRDIRGGEKKWQHVKKGVPLRVEVGPKDIAKNGVFVGRRDDGSNTPHNRDEFVANISQLLTSMQDNLFNRALEHRKQNTVTIDSLEEFKKYFTPKDEEKPEAHGGFAMCHFVDEPEIEGILKDLKVTVRCIPFEGNEEAGKCIFTGKPSQKRGIFAKSY